jgi:hypothetical protein
VVLKGQKSKLIRGINMGIKEIKKAKRITKYRILFTKPSPGAMGGFLLTLP